MEQAHLLETATRLVEVISPLVAGGALAKLGENTTDATQTLLRRAWRLLTQQLSGDERAKATLTLYEDDAEDAKMQQRLAQQIVARFAQHEAAITELAEIVRQLQAQQPTTSTTAPGRSHTLNASGNARIGTAIVGDSHGPITVGRMDFGDQGVRPAPTAPAPATPVARPRSTLPATLSADGVHFSFGHALLIGVGRYANISSPLATTTDAEQLAAVLRDPQVAAYPNEQVNVLSGAAATRAGMLDALDGLAAQVAQRKQATVLLFFAGHGTEQNGSYYLLPHDARPSDIRATSIDAATFRRKVEAIAQHAQKLVIILNCCHSGGVTDGVLDGSGEPTDTPPPPEAFYKPLTEGAGRVLISAARPAERAGAVSPHNEQLTTFGVRLLEGLRGGAPGQGPAVGVFDLFAYLANHIPTDARTITDPFTGKPLEQHPLLSARQVDQAFALALRPQATRRDDQTLDTTLDAAIQRLAEIEIDLAQYRSEADAPPALVRERDGLLARLE